MRDQILELSFFLVSMYGITVSLYNIFYDLRERSNIYKILSMNVLLQINNRYYIIGRFRTGIMDTNWTYFLFVVNSYKDVCHNRTLYGTVDEYGLVYQYMHR